MSDVYEREKKRKKENHKTKDFVDIDKYVIVLPKSGMASETWGRVSATRLRNTVRDSKMVTPKNIFEGCKETNEKIVK